MIMLYFIPSCEDNSAYEPSDFEALRTLLAISQLWRSVAMDTPSLWTNIRLVDMHAPADLASRMEIISLKLRLSKNRSLSLHVESDAPTLEPLPLLLAKGASSRMWTKVVLCLHERLVADVPMMYPYFHGCPPLMLCGITSCMTAQERKAQVNSFPFALVPYSSQGSTKSQAIAPNTLQEFTLNLFEYRMDTASRRKLLEWLGCQPITILNVHFHPSQTGLVAVLLLRLAPTLRHLYIDTYDTGYVPIFRTPGITFDPVVLPHLESLFLSGPFVMDLPVELRLFGPNCTSLCVSAHNKSNFAGYEWVYPSSKLSYIPVAFPSLRQVSFSLFNNSLVLSLLDHLKIMPSIESVTVSPRLPTLRLLETSLRNRIGVIRGTNTGFLGWPELGEVGIWEDPTLGGQKYWEGLPVSSKLEIDKWVMAIQCLADTDYGQDPRTLRLRFESLTSVCESDAPSHLSENGSECTSRYDDM